MSTVNSGTWVWGGPIGAGEQARWYQGGQRQGQVRWFSAHPINNPGLDHTFAITEVANMMLGRDGYRVIAVTVKSLGNERASYYAIYYAETN
ncbi:MAG TPA: hypothetical protein VKA70_02290 [Blastocatellia bacterium]|nr:hypothetical protein [Blastocatellia bacterium]